MDRITLRGTIAHGRHGANPGERDRPQPLCVDLVLELDLARAAASDALDDTINYALIHETIVRTIEETSFALLERLAAEILERIWGDARIRRAELTIGKPKLLDGATPSITLVRAS